MVTNVGNILGSAKRAELLALQKTARQLDDAFARLSSGQKVTSAIDNPNSFFLSRALRNRAAYLDRLLDGIGQSIRVIETADAGIKASLKTLDLAESYLQEIERKFLADEIGLGLSPVDTSVTFASAADLLVYDPAQDTALGTITVTPPNEFNLNGNFWKRRLINYTITPETVLKFEYQSTVQPEISAIGFDNDTNFGNDNRRFYLYGTQTTGITYAAPTSTFAYTGGGAWVSYEIPVGTYFTGTFSHITFVHDDDAAPFGNTSLRNIVLSEVPTEIALEAARFEEEYAKIVNQLDGIAIDANYRGINLLKDDDLKTTFNEANTSTLVTKGIDATRQGLGLQVEGFETVEDVQAKLTQVRNAREILRGYGTTLATNLNVIQIREDFTRGQINVLNAGSSELVDADLNEEGAKVIALQTRQQIQYAVLAQRPPNILDILA